MAAPRVWIFQDPKQVKKHGAAKASWYVGWYHAGKRRCESCGLGSAGKRDALKKRDKRRGELSEGTYQDNRKKTWQQFRQRYDANVLSIMDVRNRDETDRALGQFEKVIKPKMMLSITSETVAEFVARRSKGAGRRAGEKISPATINKELRHLRAVLKKAAKWKYLAEPVEFDFLKEPQKLPTYIPPENFFLIYEACDQARLPRDLPYPAADWWRGLLITGYMTGWRIGALLALRRDDVDFDAGTALSRAADNKGKRDQLIPLHPIIVEHLRKVKSFDPVFFPWNHARRKLFTEFHRIQDATAKPLKGRKGHYGFHDLRRAFATMNAGTLTADALQMLMQHRDYKTTQRYISMARQMNPTLEKLFVPELPKVGQV